MTDRKRGGLGRGLGALIPQSSVPSAVVPGAGDQSAPAARYRELPIAAIHPNPQQPRSTFDEDSLAELSTSIGEVGVLQPLIVREAAPGRYELIMGERRLRASALAGLSTVPTLIRDTADDALLRDALLENLHREDLNPLEEAAAYQQLLEDFGATHEQLGQRIGRSRSQVTNTIRLLNLPAAVQRRVAARVLSAGHARALLALENPGAQEEMATRIVAEGMSVRATEELVALADRTVPGAPPSRPRRPRLHAPALAALAARLSDRFDTRVTVDLGRRKGRITLEFASVDDLERIVALMVPPGADWEVVGATAAPRVDTDGTAPGSPSGSAGAATPVPADAAARAEPSAEAPATPSADQET